jgi:Na+/melibiose symporter-like transporter
MVAIIAFAIYAIALFAILAPNVLVQLPKSYSMQMQIFLHGALYAVVFTVSYFFCFQRQMPPRVVAKVPKPDSVTQVPTPESVTQVLVPVPAPALVIPTPTTTRQAQAQAPPITNNPYAVNYPADVPSQKSSKDQDQN